MPHDKPPTPCLTPAMHRRIRRALAGHTDDERCQRRIARALRRALKQEVS